jgi:hypothetical protein
VTIDLKNPTQTERFRAHPELQGREQAFACAFCGDFYDPSLRYAVNALCDFLRHMRDAKQAASFSIQEPSR